MNYLLFVGVSLLLVIKFTSAAITVCYFGSWAVYHTGAAYFPVSKIDPFLCTHAIYAFAGIDSSTYKIKSLDPWNDFSTGGGLNNFNNFVALKTQNPNLVVTLAVGGWGSASTPFSQMAADPVKRSAFVTSAVALLNTYHFDGLDVDWEFPSTSSDKANFVLLVKDLKTAFLNNTPKLRLTAAVSAAKATIDVAYDVTGLAQYLDAFHLMTYDFHGSWETQVNHHSPLCKYPNSTGNNVYNNDNYAASYFVTKGAPKSKIVLGVPLYANCWKLSNANVNGIYAAASGPSPAGPVTQQAGILSNYEVCLRMSSVSCTVVHDPKLNEPYFYCPSDKVWCGYEDAASAYKKGRYVVNNGYAGAMVWDIAEEDFIPKCAAVSFPLIRQIKQALSLAADAVPFTCPP